MAILGRGRPAKAIIVTAQGVQVVGTQAIVVTTPVDRRFKRVNRPAIGSGPGVPVSGDPRIAVVAAARDRRFSRVYPAVVAQGSAQAAPDVSPYSVTVVASPVPATWRRVNTPLVTQGPAEPVAGPAVVAAAPVPRSLLRITAPFIGQGAAEPVPGPIIVSTPRNPKVLAPQPIIVTNAPPEVPFTPGSPGTQPIVRPGPSPRPTTRPPLVLTGAPGVPAPPVPPANVAWCAQTPITGWVARDPLTGWEADTPATNWIIVTPEEDC